MPAPRDRPPTPHRLSAARVRLGICALWAGSVLLQIGCSGARSPTENRIIERGVASWYGGEFHGRSTASGERYDMHGLTAAHRTLPFGTVVEVHDLDNDRRVQVRITDRGPFVRGRILDLSYAAAKQLDMIGPGTAHVELLLVSSPTPVPTVTAVAERGPPAPAAVATAAASSGPWTVQVGAFEDPQRAADLRDLLSRHYPDTVIRTAGAWHRVQIGTFKKRKKADAFRRELQELGWDAVVVAVP